jgi:hypothetical protein
VIRRSNLRIASLRDSDTRTAMMPRRILQSCLGRPWENVNVLGGISSYVGFMSLDSSIEKVTKRCGAGPRSEVDGCSHFLADLVSLRDKCQTVSLLIDCTRATAHRSGMVAPRRD